MEESNHEDNFDPTFGFLMIIITIIILATL